MKTDLNLILDRDKEHPMGLNFECILGQIEFSQFPPHLIAPKSVKEIWVRLNISSFIKIVSLIMKNNLFSQAHLVAESRLKKLQRFEHSEMEIIFSSLEQGDWHQHRNKLQSADKHLEHFQLQSTEGFTDSSTKSSI